MALWLHSGMQLVAIEINNACFAKFAMLEAHFASKLLIAFKSLLCSKF